MIFLIHYDRRAGAIRAMTSFTDDDRVEAEAARLVIELAHGSGGSESEVVLLESQSEDELRRTHGRYFATASDLVKTAADEATTASLKD